MKYKANIADEVCVLRRGSHVRILPGAAYVFNDCGSENRWRRVTRVTLQTQFTNVLPCGIRRDHSEGEMPTLHEKIAAQFLAELAELPEFDKDKIDKLKELLAGKKKMKPEEVVTVLSQPHGGEIK